MTVQVSNKQAEIAMLKADPLKFQTEGPCIKVVHKLQKQNDQLLEKAVVP